jgi:pilus assembly protein CpaF
MIFGDESQLEDVTGRLLKRAGAVLRADLPIVEAGFVADNGRFVSVTMASPPVTYALSMDIRLHPVEAPTLASLVERGTLTEKAARLLRALMQSEYGFVLAGQPESGKTMTLSALLRELPNPAKAAAVERTGELHLPPDMRRAVVEWADRVGDTGVTFGDQIEAQIEKGCEVLVLDEVRADEPQSIAPLLEMDDPPRLIWSFRGAPDSKRLVSALGMLARRAKPNDSETLVQRLFKQMPYVVSVRRREGQIELREVGEWYNAEERRYRALMQTSGGETFTTGEIPDHPLPGLDALFWSSSD